MSTLAAIWSQLGSPMGPRRYRRVWIFLGVVAIAVVAWLSLLEYHRWTTPSRLPRIQGNQTTTGVTGVNASRIRLQTLEAMTTEQARDARQRGESALTPVEDSDSMEKLRQQREKTAARTGTRQITPPPAAPEPPNRDRTRGFLAAINLAMLGARARSDDAIDYNPADPPKRHGGDGEGSVRDTAGAAASGATEASREPRHGLGLAGYRVFAYTVTAATLAADNAARTPVVVQMTSGPLTGYRLQGLIEKHEDHLTVTFGTLDYNGQTVAVKAIMLSPETQELMVASSVDHQYAARIGVPALVGAARGFGQAAQLSGSTFAAGPYGGAASYGQFSPWRIAGSAAGGAAEGVQGVLHEALPKGSIVTLAANAPVEILFQDDVSLPGPSP